jgi:hypothetical protein
MKIKPIFISYSRKDKKEVELLVKTLHAAGIKTWQDVTSLDMEDTIPQIKKAINDECSGMVFYATPNSIRSDFIKAYELPPAIDRSTKDDDFAGIYYVYNVDLKKAEQALRNISLPPLSNINGVMVEHAKGFKRLRENWLGNSTKLLNAFKELRQKILARIFKSMTDTHIKIAINTYVPTPETFQPVLDFDWSQLSKENDFFSVDHWQNDIRDAFIDVRNILSKKNIKTLEISSHAQLQIGFAFGYIFRRESFLLKIHHQGQIWTTQHEINKSNHLTCETNEIKPGVKHMAVGISIQQDVKESLNQFVAAKRREMGQEMFNRIILLSPKDGCRYQIPDDVIASEISEEVRLEIIKAKKHPITDIHLFAAIPLPLAYMIGWRLNACGKIHLYHHDKSTLTYQPSWILDGKD